MLRVLDSETQMRRFYKNKKENYKIKKEN